MARALTFTLDGGSYSAAPTKVDRRKLYGWRQTVALDDAGRECNLASMDGSGTLIIPPGGTGLGVLGPDRQWVERSSLKAVTLDGADAPLLPSSFDAPVELTATATPDDVLDCNIVSVYELDGGDALATALGDRIVSFDYVYRAGYTSSRAFVLAADSAAFMLVGYKNDFEFVGLNQVDAIDEPEETDDSDDSDDMLRLQLLTDRAADIASALGDRPTG